MQVEAHVALSGLHGRARQFVRARAHAEAALRLAPDNQRRASESRRRLRQRGPTGGSGDASRARLSPLAADRHPRGQPAPPRADARQRRARQLAGSPIWSRRRATTGWSGSSPMPTRDCRRGRTTTSCSTRSAIADAAAASRRQLAAFAARCERPVLNPPGAHRFDDARSAHRHCSRESPICRSRRPAASDRAWESRRIARPINFGWCARSARTAASAWSEVASAAAARRAAALSTAFHDFRSGDGLYRKYRMFFVDRVAYPYHLGDP